MMRRFDYVHFQICRFRAYVVIDCQEDKKKRKNAPEREHIMRLSSFHPDEVDEVELDCRMTIRPPKWLYQTKKIIPVEIDVSGVPSRLGEMNAARRCSPSIGPLANCSEESQRHKRRTPSLRRTMQWQGCHACIVTTSDV